MSSGVALVAGLFMLVAGAGCRGPRVLPAERPVPDGVAYLSRTDWQAAPPTMPMKAHTPLRITIHHTGTKQAPEHSLADKMRALQRFSQSEGTLGNGRPKRAWADVPYHFYIGTDGIMAEGREHGWVGDSNTPYDPTGHLLIVVEGNFEVDSLTSAQRRTLDAVVVAFAARWNVPGERIAGHRDFAQTSCPGRALYGDLPRIRTLVGQR